MKNLDNEKPGRFSTWQKHCNPISKIPDYSVTPKKPTKTTTFNHLCNWPQLAINFIIH